MQTSTDNPAIAKSIAANGIRTNYHDVGSGDPVVLIHGSAPGVSAWSNWRSALPVLAEKWRVIAPDVPGFGYSERPQGVTYEMKFWVAHMLAFLDSLGMERASFIGNSFGGGLSMALAAAAPDRVNRLILMGSGGLRFKVTEGLMASWSYTPSVANMRSLLTRFVYDKGLVTDELVAQRHQASIEADAGEVFRHLMPPEKRTPDAIINGMPEEMVAGIKKQTLILHGRDDAVVPVANSIRLNELIDDSQLHVFGRCGHWVQHERREEFHGLVVDFLER